MRLTRRSGRLITLAADFRVILDKVLSEFQIVNFSRKDTQGAADNRCYSLRYKSELINTLNTP
jgi:hypothetical protein